MTQTTRVHDYLSTYCWHEDHDDCRQACKTCKRPCRCGCHRTEQTPTTPAAESTTGQPDGRMGGPVPHANRPAGWYRTMDRGFALGHFGFPALPRRGERHTASDRSVWEFALTSTDWWELAEHAPEQDPAARIAELESALQTAREMYTSARERAAGSPAVALLDYALRLRMYGERAPGGDETWREWDARTETFLRSLADTAEGGRMSPSPDCELCPHPWLDHDGMGDCHHLDRRTRTGYCAGHETRPDPTEEPDA